MSGYAQKGIPAYKIYGEQVQDSDDKSIPADVQEKSYSLHVRVWRLGK